MSMIQTTNRRYASQAREQLQQGVRWTAQRGRLLASLSAMILSLAVFVGGLFVIAIKDVLLILPQPLRAGLLISLLVGVVVVALVRIVRAWLNKRFNRAAGEQIDHAAQAAGQPVTVGLSLQDPIDDDSLALALLQRAETRAAEVAQAIKPGKAYPWRRLRSPGHWLLLSLGLWLLLALILPSQAWAIASRVLMPWGDSPPFSLTQLEPTWTPEPPDAGDDVLVSVVPEGRMPESVDWVRLDEGGKEIERFEMATSGQGSFSLLLSKVESPIDFHLEAFGRHSRTYTITPTPRPPAEPEQPDEDQSQGQGESNSDGSTTFDPDKVAQRELDTHPEWPGIKEKLEALLKDLANAEKLAGEIAPADAEAMQGLADQLAELTAKAGAIADELEALQGDLPAEAGELLDELTSALMNMQSAALGGPPSEAEGAQAGDQPTPEEWLEEAGDAAEADQQRIGKGLGPSDEPTDSGTTSGQGGDDRPDIRDPSTSGSTTSRNTSGDTGPLPDSVMQQIPMSYRDFVSAYFEKLAEE